MRNEKLAVEYLELKVNALESVLNDVGAYIYSKDLQGNYTFCNVPLLALFNKTMAEVVGKDAGHFFDLNRSAQLRNNDLQVMRENITLEKEEVNFVKELAETRVFNTLKKPLHDSQGKVIGMFGISKDITAQKKQETLIKEQKQLLDAILDNVDAYIYMKDNTRTFRYANRKLVDLIGLPIEQIIGKKDTELFSQESADNFWPSDKKVLDTQEKLIVEEHFENINGVVRHYHSVKVPYKIKATTPAVIGFSTDITELYQLKEKLQKQANTDSLTELNNRRYFLKHAQREYFRAKRHNLPMAVITLDIDNFKLINDSYGHPVGDRVLIALSKNLAASVRSEDILSRTGGEEFSICLPETNEEQAIMLAQRIRSTQEQLKITGNWQGEIQITLSIGVATFKASDENFDALFSRVDKALYVAKHEGKNQVYCSRL